MHYIHIHTREEREKALDCSSRIETKRERYEKWVHSAFSGLSSSSSSPQPLLLLPLKFKAFSFEDTIRFCRSSLTAALNFPTTAKKIPTPPSSRRVLESPVNGGSVWNGGSKELHQQPPTFHFQSPPTPAGIPIPPPPESPAAAAAVVASPLRACHAAGAPRLPPRLPPRLQRQQRRRHHHRQRHHWRWRVQLRLQRPGYRRRRRRTRLRRRKRPLASPRDPHPP